MAYNYPTEEGIKYAMEQGWSKEQAERGFEIFNFDGTGMLEIEAITDCYIKGGYDDDEASKEAERIGYCKIIPIDELPNPFIYDGISRRYFGWIDTPENRKAIEDYCKKYCSKQMNKTYYVTIKISGEYIAEVNATSFEDAKEKAINSYYDADFGCLTDINANEVYSAYTEDEEFEEHYY